MQEVIDSIKQSIRCYNSDRKKVEYEIQTCQKLGFSSELASLRLKCSLLGEVIDDLVEIKELAEQQSEAK